MSICIEELICCLRRKRPSKSKKNDRVEAPNSSTAFQELDPPSFLSFETRADLNEAIQDTSRSGCDLKCNVYSGR
jgi:hypothetical protein